MLTLDISDFYELCFLFSSENSILKDLIDLHCKTYGNGIQCKDFDATKAELDAARGRAREYLQDPINLECYKKDWDSDYLEIARYEAIINALAFSEASVVMTPYMVRTTIVADMLDRIDSQLSYYDERAAKRTYCPSKSTVEEWITEEDMAREWGEVALESFFEMNSEKFSARRDIGIVFGLLSRQGGFLGKTVKISGINT